MTLADRRIRLALGALLPWFLVLTTIPLPVDGAPSDTPLIITLPPLESRWISMEAGAGETLEYRYESSVLETQLESYTLDPVMNVHILDPGGNLVATHVGGVAGGRIDITRGGLWSIMLVNFESLVTVRVLLYLHFLPAESTNWGALALLAAVVSGLIAGFAYRWRRRSQPRPTQERGRRITYPEDMYGRTQWYVGLIIQRYV